MDRFPQNTWRTGLDRILLGVAMSGDDHRHLGTGLPLDDVGSNEIDLAGRLAELRRPARPLPGRAARGPDGRRVDGRPARRRPRPHRRTRRRRLAAPAARARAGPRRRVVRHGGGGSSSGWPTCARCSAAGWPAGPPAPTSAPAPSPSARWCRCARCRTAWSACSASTTASSRGPASSTATTCSARRPRTGERDGRSEDRQLLLDAVMAATEHLVITYTGANEHSGARRPPAVPLGELLDAADRTTAAPVRDAILTRHPLQPYDPRNLKAGDPATRPARVGDPRAARPDPAAVQLRRRRPGRRARRGRRTPPRAAAAHRRPAAARRGEDVSLDDLVRSSCTRCGRSCAAGSTSSTPFEPDELADAIPVALDSLEVWQVGDRLLRELLAGQDPVAVMTAEQLRGTLPPVPAGRAARCAA